MIRASRIVLYSREEAWAARIALDAATKIPRTFELPDLQQIARLALWQACLDYAPPRPLRNAGVHWRAFAYPRIHGAVMMSVRRNRWREATDWVPISPNGAGLLVAGPEQEREAECHRMADLLAGMVLRLPRSERRVVEWSLRGWSFARIADKYQTSTDAVYRIRKRALAILRREMGALGIHGSAAWCGSVHELAMSALSYRLASVCGRHITAPARRLPAYRQADRARADRGRGDSGRDG